MPRLRQETIAIIGVGAVLFATCVTLAAFGASIAEGLRDEIRAVRVEVEAVRVEARADREAIRAEARADREAFQRQMQEFQKQILRLTEGQGRSNGQVDGLLRERQDADGGPEQ